MKFRVNQVLTTRVETRSFVRDTVIPAGTKVIVTKTAVLGTRAQAIVDPGEQGLGNPLGGLPIVISAFHVNHD